MLELIKRKLFKIIFWLFVFFALPFTVLMFVGSQRYVYRAEVKINSTADNIFPYLYTSEKFSVWQSSLKSISLRDNKFNQPGHTATLILDGGEKDHRIPITIEDISPNTRLRTSSESKVFKTQTTWDLKAVGDHSIVRQEVICFYSGVGRLMAPFLTDDAENQLQADLNQLRETVETEAVK
ncbi:MAG: hypothetical protein CMJ55_03090 [Planctomycetaceae bacterium]|nr:hypothetical protein [Planctomycetaceae bacterium]